LVSIGVVEHPEVTTIAQVSTAVPSEENAPEVEAVGRLQLFRLKRNMRNKTFIAAEEDQLKTDTAIFQTVLIRILL
jgi:hypothetical protein